MSSFGYNEMDHYHAHDVDFEDGDCPACDGTGDVPCSSCEGSGCRRCADGQRTCSDCDGSGFRPVEPDGNEDV